MKTFTLAALLCLSTLATPALAQPGVPDAPEESPWMEPVPGGDGDPNRTRVVTIVDAPARPAPPRDDDAGWGPPVGKRFLHGFRLGYLHLHNHKTPDPARDGMSIEQQLELKTNHMMLLGYEGFYRMVGHSWLNVLLVGNVTIAGLEQSKFIPAASGLIGFEFDQSFQLGVGVNLIPDAAAPSHMIVAAGWTPRVGAMHVPVHFFFVPDAGDARNHRTGMTVGVTW